MQAPMNAGGWTPSTISGLDVVRGAQFVNNAATIVGMGLLLVVPPAGATVLTVTTLAGTALGVTEGVMTYDSRMVLISVAAPVLGAGVGHLALGLFGREAVEFASSASRYRSVATGRFVTTAGAATSVQLINTVDTASGAVVDQFGDREH